MKRFLLLINTFLFCFISLCGQNNTSDDCGGVFVFSDNGRADYNIFLKSKKAEISGICIMKLSQDKVSGTVINEFGVKAFDFYFLPDSKKVKLINVISFLDKCHIKNAIKSDLKFLFLRSGDDTIVQKCGRRVEINEEGRIILSNRNSHLTYTFSPQ